jgi:uncharacterized protein YbjT (DUF2867 family)
MVLVTGAAGKTGRAVIRALAARETAVRALIHHEPQSAAVLSEGAAEVVVGDMAVAGTFEQAMSGVSAVYFICPNVHHDEARFGRAAIEAARAAGIAHFVYHSVLHPQVEAMPHHWLKMRVEEQLFASGLPFTILQPAAYMQNVLANWSTIVNEGVYRVPYSAETRLCMVDLEDVAQAVALILTEPGHNAAVYELAGKNTLSQIEVAAIIGEKLNKPIKVEQISLDEWRQSALQNGLGRYQVETLIKMFVYYDQHGFYGNSNVLAGLLRRPPNTFAEFLDRFIS